MGRIDRTKSDGILLSAAGLRDYKERNICGRFE